MGQLYLSMSSYNLSEVEVRDKRSRLEIDRGRKIFWVGENLVSLGGSASDLLENIPSIAVDIAGEIQLRGTSATLQINGQTYDSDRGRLQRLPSHLIERIEIITNPSAREQASGQAGIINIILKKDPNDGTSTTISVLGGYPVSTQASVIVDHRRKPLYAQGFYSFSRLQEQGWDSQQLQKFTHNLEYQNQSNQRKEIDYSHTGELELEYSLNEKNLLTISSSFEYGAETLDLTGSRVTSNESTPSASFTRQERESGYEYAVEGELGYEKTFANDNQQLEVYVEWELENTKETENVLEAPIELPSSYKEQKSFSKEVEEELSAEVEYVHPLGEDISLNMGYEVESEHSDKNERIQIAEQLDTNMIIKELSNDITFRRTIQGAFVEYEQETGDFYYRVGIRSEFTDRKVYQGTSEDTKVKRYIDFFPNLLLQCEISDVHTFKAGYNRRIRRPRLSRLNPFIGNLDPQRVRRGNPYLKPEYSHSVELEYLWKMEKATLSTTIYGRHQTNIEQYIIMVEDSITIFTPQNISQGHMYGGEIIYSGEIFSWISTDVSLSTSYHSVFDGNQSSLVDNQYFTFATRVSNTFDVGKLKLQSAFSYRGAERSTRQMRNASVYYADIGISRSVFDDKGKITFTIKDLFNTNIREVEVAGEDFVSVRKSQRRQRQFFMGLSYYINQRDKRKNKQIEKIYENDSEYDQEF